MVYILSVSTPICRGYQCRGANLMLHTWRQVGVEVGRHINLPYVSFLAYLIQMHFVCTAYISNIMDATHTKRSSYNITTYVKLFYIRRLITDLQEYETACDLLSEAILVKIG